MRWSKEQYAAYLAKQGMIPVAETLAKAAPSGITTDEEKLNKTERAYLALLRTEGHPWLAIQAITLKLADDCRLTPDFAYCHRHGGQLVFVDVKGFQREDALIKMKVAARLMPWAQFVIVKRKGGKVGGSWHTKVVNP